MHRPYSIAKESAMLIGFVSDEYYAALPDVQLEVIAVHRQRHVARSSASGAVCADLSPGDYEVCLSKPGFGSKRVRIHIDGEKPWQFRLLADGLLGYAWPKWCRGGD